MQALFFSSSSSSNQISKGQVNLTPVVMGGGVINQNGDIGNGNVNFSGTTSAQAGSFGLDFSMPMMPMQLMNLDDVAEWNANLNTNNIHSRGDLDAVIQERENQFIQKYCQRTGACGLLLL